MRAQDREPLWAKVTVKVAPDAAPGVADILFAAAHGVEERKRASEVWLIAYVPAHRDLSRVIASVTERLQALQRAGLDTGRASISARRIRSRPWEEAWKAGLDVVHVGRRLAIKPTWKTYAARPGETVIELDPGMAFGTGDHATTRGCLAALGRCVRGGELVFDIGAGSGILAIAAAKLGARRVVGIEIDESAARVAAHNVGLNRVGSIVAVVCGDGLRCLRPRAEVIVANLTSHDIAALAPQVRGHLAPGGVLIASGISTAHEGAVRDAGAAEGLSVRDRRQEGEWLTMVWEVGSDAQAAG